MNNATNTIDAEYQRRMKLIEDQSFRTLVKDKMVQMGISSIEWSKDKALYYMMFANEFCGIEDKQLAK